MAGDTGNHVYRGERKPNGENTQCLHCAFPAGTVPSGIHYQGSV